MTTRLRWPGALLLSLSFVACGGAVGESATSSTEPDAGSGAAADGGLVTDAATVDAATADATRPVPSTGVVWVHAEASSFDPNACKDPVSSDFIGLGNYLYTQASNAGLKGASVSAGGGVCAFGSSPTTMAESYVFTGTVAAAQALKATPPAPFRGTYVTVPLVVKGVLSVKFGFFVGDTAGGAHAFDDVWVHDGLNFDGEAAFAGGVCNEKASFDAAIAASPVGATVKAWLAGQSAASGYRLGYDATFTFDDGTTTTIANAHQAAGGPTFAPCPNLVAASP